MRFGRGFAVFTCLRQRKSIMKPTFNLFVLAALLLHTGCSDNEPAGPLPGEPVQFQLPVKSGAVISTSNSFGIDLFKRTALDEPDENLMLSPLSASVALTMLLNGCSNQTYDQIHAMLAYDSLSPGEVNNVYRALVKQLLAADPSVKLAIANAVWYRLGFDVYTSYLDSMNQVFNAHIEGLDFNQTSSVETMNQWASDQTYGKIEQVIDQISPQAVMFLMNALYFKGTWTWQFDPANTQPGTFFTEDGTSLNVPMMYGKIPVKTYSGTDYNVLELFYGRKNFSMVIILPNGSLTEYLDGFSGTVWHQVTTGLDDIEEPQELDVRMPKFSFEYEKILNDQLQAMGMTDAFVPGMADLTRISGDELFVSFVKQNTFVDVNEEGTTAAAVTTIGIDVTSIMEFTVNRPFVFAIRERTTNTLLFIGKVTDPQ
jgi:serpin B